MSEALSPAASPCQQCGSCCATFRVSFYWAEATELGLPGHLIENLGPTFSCMAGTNQSKPRCKALEGVVGGQVACGVYAQRPSPCHELKPGEEKCNRARTRHGLPALPSKVAANPSQI